MTQNPIDYAILNIMHLIPEPILNETFKETMQSYNCTLSHAIEMDVIRTRIYDDCNLYAGRIIQFELLEKYLIESENIGNSSNTAGTFLATTKYGVYKIPKEVTDNEPITSCISCKYPYNYGVFPAAVYGPYTGVTLGNIADAAIQSMTYSTMLPIPVPILMTGTTDVIILEPRQQSHVNYVVTVRVAYSDQFLNLNRSAWKPFADLVLCAVKSYIYNKLVLKLDKAKILTGSEWGVFKDIVDRYADENEKYHELLLTFRGASTIDPERLRHLLRWRF